MNITSRFDRFAELHPDKPAFIFFQDGDWRTVTYRQLSDLTERFVFGLLDSGLTPGMTAALLTPPSADFFALAFALLKVGVVPIILDPAIGLKKVGECLAEAQPDIFIGNGLTHALRIVFGWGKDSVKYNLTVELVKSKKSKSETLIPNLPIYQLTDLPTTTPAAVIYTSGSTGIPKGVLFTHENLSAQLDMLVETFGIAPDEIDLPAFPLYALIDVLLGVTSVIPDISFPVPGKTDPAKVFQAIQRFDVTNMFASPVVLDILSKKISENQPRSLKDTKSQSFSSLSLGDLVSLWLESQAFPKRWSRYGDGSRYASSRLLDHCLLGHRFPSLKRVITAGAPATIQLQQDFRKLLDDKTDLFGIYGATEVLPIAKVESREIFEVREKSARGAGVCLGRPVDGAKVRIIGISESAIQRWQDSLEVEPNVVGEITVQGGAVTEHYIVRDEANRLSKIQHEDGIIHRMGDVGYFDEEGRLWYCGRKSHRVITKDAVMFTEQIEGIFNVHPLVYRTALVGVDGVPVLWVEIRRDSQPRSLKDAKTQSYSSSSLGVLASLWSKHQTFQALSRTSEVFIQDTIKRELMDLAKDHPQASKIKDFLFMKKFPIDVRHNSKIIREELTAKTAKYAKKNFWKFFALFARLAVQKS
jgi:acyl-CoA synthetase (AMP-forming)/AMP-acid ligase II